MYFSKNLLTHYGFSIQYDHFQFLKRYVVPQNFSQSLRKRCCATSTCAVVVSHSGANFILGYAYIMTVRIVRYISHSILINFELVYRLLVELT